MLVCDARSKIGAIATVRSHFEDSGVAMTQAVEVEKYERGGYGQLGFLDRRR